MNISKKIPCDKMLDSSLCLLREGYPFIQNRCYRYRTDIFQARIMGQKIICMSGKEAAKIFYDNTLFERKDVAPKRVQKTLFGLNGVQGLDGNAHSNRKQMFMSIMTSENYNLLIQYTKEQWEYNSRKWNNSNIILYDEAQLIMCQVACRWAGIFLRPFESRQRASDLGKMIDGFGGVGPRYWQGKCARKRCEQWIRDIIIQIRTQKLSTLKGTAAHIIAWHRDQNNKLLSSQIATVELLNIIRPIVAIATYITFGALALYDFPHCRRKMRMDDDKYKYMFVQEVRRYYPFTPFVGARVKKNFIWKQYYLKKGTLVLLDIYGICHDPRLWSNPYDFIPERFLIPADNTFTFIPQGGGYFDSGHRCAGETVTVEVMKESLDFLANKLSYKVPKQNLDYRLSRIPTLPKSRFIITRVKLNTKVNTK